MQNKKKKNGKEEKNARFKFRITPIRHGRNRLEGLNKVPIRMGTAGLQLAKGARQKLSGAASSRLGNNSG